MNETHQRFNDSALRCLQVPGFFDRLQGRLKEAGVLGMDDDASSGAMRPLHLGASLFHCLSAAQGDPVSITYLRRLGAFHSRTGFGATMPFYALWLEALITTVNECDPLFDEATEKAWRVILRCGIAFMHDAHRTTETYSSG